jgi:hypothetical protein
MSQSIDNSCMHKVATAADLSNIRQRKLALKAAVEKQCSTKWILRLWGFFIKERDSYRCVCCGSENHIQAHHIVRKTLYPLGAVETGNGITLCRECHGRVHEKSNGLADLSLPLAEADDQDEWAFLFGLLLDDAKIRGLDQDEFYFFEDHMLRFFVNVQGYENMHEAVAQGEISRISFAHEIWQVMPESWCENFVSDAIRLNL